MMADKLDEAEFWLPSEFLTDEDILMDNKENLGIYGIADSKPANLCFLPAFPYDYASSPVESLVGSAETESDEEDSLLTGLTHQLTLQEAQSLTTPHHNHENKWPLSASPQSTLTQVGSWSGRSTVSSNRSPNGPSQVSSPPTTPLGSNSDAWDLIYQAAGQVARLRMNSGDGLPRNKGLMHPLKCPATPPTLKSPPSCTFDRNPWQQVHGEQLKQEGCGMWNGQLKNRWSNDHAVFQNGGARIGVTVNSGNAVGGGFLTSSCAWPSVPVQQRNRLQFGELGVRGGVSTGSRYGYGYGYGSGSGGGGAGGVKRECAGTGVFLPRRYGNNNNPSNISDSRKKQGSSSALLQSGEMHALNKSPDNTSVISQHQPQSHLSGAYIANYDALLARRNALLAQQRQSLCPEASISHEICLPQEWTY